MKKELLVSIVALSLLLSGCNSGQKIESSVSSDETTTTTAAVTETVTTTAAETTAADKPEDYADVGFSDSDGANSDNAFATEFNFIDAEITKDNNGVYRYPNFSADKEIKITFKSDKELTNAVISRTAYPKSTISSTNTVSVLDNVEDGENEKFAKFLTFKDGIYSLVIPADYVKQDNYFSVSLYTKQGEGLFFRVSCLSEDALKNAPKYSAEEHGGVLSTGIEVSDFNFINAKLEVLPSQVDKHAYEVQHPHFPVNQDIVVTFKCKQKLKITEVGYYLESENREEKIEISKEMLVNSKGIYTFTLPAKYAVNGVSFWVRLIDKNDNHNNMQFLFDVQ